MTEPTIFHQFLIWPFINLLILFYKFFEIARIPGAFGWAIITMTLVIRGSMQPLTRKQMESAHKMQALKPHIDKLQQKHKDNKQKFQEEQLKLYKEHGVNPLGGCLPSLLSLPILFALYQVFLNVLNNGNLQETVQNINQIVYVPFLKIQSLDLSFFGIQLAIKPSQWQEFGWWLLAIPLVTGFLQWYQMKKTMPPQQPAQPIQPHKKGDEKKSDMGAEMQKQMMLIFPVMIGFAAYNFPLGIALYWNTFSLISLWGIKRRVEVKKP